MTEDELNRLAELVANKLMQAQGFANDGEVDWRNVELPSFRNRRVQTAQLDPQSFAWLKVVAWLLGKPVAVTVNNAIATYLYRNKKNHLEKLHVVATKKKMTLEACVSAILAGTIGGH